MSQQNKKILTIGIPVRNEAKSLPYFLKSLVFAVNEITDFIEVEIIFCINGCSDDSLIVIQEFTKHLHSFNVEIIQSILGKMQAQKEIVRFSKSNGPIVFLDADILLDKNCLKNLWNSLNKNSSLQVVFSRVYPIWDKSSFFRWLQKAYYEKDDEIRESRRYIHGRSYIIRSKDFFTINDLQNRINLAKQNSQYDNHLFIEKGPQIDDIYLSRFLAHKFGISSIKEVQESKVFFIPPSIMWDYYQEQKRIALEIIRNDILFPEHSYTQKHWFVRKLLWNRFKKLGLWTTIHYFLYLTFAMGIKNIVRYRLLIGEKMKIGFGTFWRPLSSTKKITENIFNSITQKN